MSAQLQEHDNSPLITYSITDAKLAELRQKYAEVPDATTPEGYALVKAGLSELVPLRTGVDKKRKELKAESLEWGRKVDAEAKRITEVLEAIETPLRSAKEAVDAEAERVKQEAAQAAARALAAIQARIDGIQSFANSLVGSTAEQLRAALDKLNAMTIDDVYGGMKSRAEQVHADVTAKVTAALVEREAFEAQKAIMDKQAAELKAQQEAMAAEQAKITAAQEAHNAALRAEQDKIAAETQKAEREAQQKRDAELAAERAEAARVKADAERLQREADQARAAKDKEEAETAKREANKKHCAKIRDLAIGALVEHGFQLSEATGIVTLISTGAIPNITINY